MHVDIQYRPSHSLAMVTLEPGEPIQVEAGAMVGMSPGLSMETSASGGLLKSLSRSIFGRQSFFLNTFTGSAQGDSIALAPPLPGDIAVIEMHGESLLVQSGCYLASSAGIDVDTKWSGAKTFFGGEGLIMLRVQGTGTLLVSSFGAIHPMDLEAGQEYTVDTGHLVTFEEQIGFEVKTVAGWKSTLLSGEGLVVRLQGPGRVTLQSRSQEAFLAWLIPQLPKPTSHGSSGR